MRGDSLGNERRAASANTPTGGNNGVRDGQHLAWSSDQDPDQQFEIEKWSHEEASWSRTKRPGVGIKEASKLIERKKTEDAQDRYRHHATTEEMKHQEM